MISLTDARARWAGAQWLDQRRDASLHDVCSATGWIRTLGGAAGYLALWTRTPGVTVELVNAAVESGDLKVLPAARGCIYLVPRAHAALALRLADSLSATRNTRDLEKAGATEHELEVLGEHILEALAEGPASTTSMRNRLPSDAARSLGEAGKKVGITSTLPPALRRLEFAGRVERCPLDSRLDHERYAWRLPTDNVLQTAPQLADVDEVHKDMAALYFSWAGPATRKEFASWTGLNQTQARAAIAAAGLVEVEVELLGECFAHPDSQRPSASERVALLPALDNFFGLRASALPLVEPEHAHIEVAMFGNRPSVPLGEATLPLERTMAHAGRIVGTWGWDTEEGRVEAHAFDAAQPDAEELRAATQLLRTLGHGKSFSLDNDQSLQTRLDRMRAR